MRKGKCLRIVSAVVGLVFMLAPLAPAVDAVLQGKDQMVQTLKDGKVFAGTDDPDGSAERLGSWLAALDAVLPVLQSQQAAEKVFCGELAGYLEKWGKAIGDAKIEGPAGTKLAEAEKEIREQLLSVLKKRVETADFLTGQIGRARTALDNVKKNKALNPDVVGAVLRIQARFDLTDSAHDFTRTLWGLFLALQPEFGVQAKLDAARVKEMKDAADALSQRLEEDASRYVNARVGMEQLARVAQAPLKEINLEQEAKQLVSARQLVDKVIQGLGTRQDANSKAHLELVKRIDRLVATRSRQLVEFAGKPVGGLAGESFLLQPDVRGVAGAWVDFAKRHEQIGRELVAGLKVRETAVAEVAPALKKALDQAGGVLGKADFSKGGLGQDDVAALQSLKTDLDESYALFGKMLAEKDAVLQELKASGGVAFENPNLGSTRDAACYEKLGVLYEAMLNEARDLDRSLGVVQSVAESVKDPQAAAAIRELGESLAAVRAAAGKAQEVEAAEQGKFEALRVLGQEVVKEYTAQVKGFADGLQALAKTPGEGERAVRVKEISAQVARSAQMVSGLSDALLGKGKPEAAFTWDGASTLGAAMARMLERGGYFQNQGLKDAKAAMEGKDAFAADVALVDVALATDYPVRLFVTETGFRLVVGLDAKGKVIEGIGNIDDVKFAAAQTPPDFLVEGVVVGGFWSSLGAGIGEVASFVWQTTKKFGENIATDPLKLLEYGIYAAAVVAVIASGGMAAAPLAAFILTDIALVSVISDVAGAVIDVAADRKWISQGTRAVLKGIVTLVGIVKDGFKQGFKNMFTALKNAPWRVKSVAKALWQLIRGGNPVNTWRRVKQFLDTLGGVNAIVGTLKDIKDWLTGGDQGGQQGGTQGGQQGGTQGGQQGGTGSQPGTGLPQPGGSSSGSGGKVPKLDKFR